MSAFPASASDLPREGESLSNFSDISKFVTEAAAHAPSVYNTSPWWFSTTESGILVHADTERRLNVADPAGRELGISCGAAVFTCRVAFRYLGLEPTVSALPESDPPYLVAEIGTADERKPPSDYERQLFDLIASRCNHQGGFDNDRLPAGLIATLGEEASRESAQLVVMADDGHRAALLTVMEAADAAFALDSARLHEQAKWLTPSEAEPRDAGWGRRSEESGTKAASPGVVTVLATAGDERADWVAAGQALQRVLLAAGSKGASVSVTGQALEYPQLRDFISTELIGGVRPQMIMSFGMMGHTGSIT